MIAPFPGSGGGFGNHPPMLRQLACDANHQAIAAVTDATMGPRA